MLRIFFSPLFIGLVALAVGQAILFRRWRHLPRLERWACLLLAISTGMLLVVSLPLVANLLLYSLERQYAEPTTADLTRADAVVVLDAGYVKGKDPSRDRLGGPATGRVFCGVDGFKASGARWLIMSGGRRPVELMRALAIDRGVPAERVLLEPFSRNTFQHPIEVRKLTQVRHGDAVVVVTDAYHIPRAMGEFKRHFPGAIAAPCNASGPFSLQLRQFLPQAGALDRTTSMAQEYLGIAWYTIRHLAD